MATEKKKNPGGRGKKHRATKERKKQVETLAAYGTQQEIIAEMLNISVKTLRLHYRHELNTGAARATAVVAGNLYNHATKNNDLKAQIFWLQTRGGEPWKKNEKREISGAMLNLHGDASAENTADSKIDFSDPVQASRYYKEVCKSLGV